MDAEASNEKHRRDFLWFCSRGRLVGTPGNDKAAEHLQKMLGDRGYEPRMYVNPKEASRPLAYMALALAFGGFSWHYTRLVSTIWATALMATPFFLAARAMWRGSPLAVYGVRPSESDDTKPTIVLGAHYDTVSAYVSGSFLGQLAKMLAILMALGLFETLISPVVAAIVAIPAGCLVFGNKSLGADDNASGVFAVLRCIDRLSDHTNVHLIPVFFNYEEEGLFGSQAFFRRFLSKRAKGIDGVRVDPQKAHMVNFDCVGRGKRIYVSGDTTQRTAVLNSALAKELGAVSTSFYASDHLSVRSPWKAISFAKADRFWMLDLSWVHSKNDTPDEVRSEYIDEVAAMTETYVRALAQREEAAT